MKLTVIGSSSKGNGYVLQDENEALVIEAGVSYKRLQEAVSFNVKKIVGCLVTHEHGDHASRTEMYLYKGIKVYMSEGTKEFMLKKRETLKLKNCVNIYTKPSVLVPHKKTKIGNFTVLAFDVKHDAAEPLGFLIHHPKVGNVLFMTDTYYSEYKFKNLNHIIVEANYCRDILNKRFSNNDIHPVVYYRLFRSHMSIQSTIELLDANDLENVKNIILIHLSQNNSDEKDFKRQIVEATGIQTTIADIGVELNLGI